MCKNVPRPRGRTNRVPKALRLTIPLLSVILALVGAGCGTTDGNERARDLYRAYRSAEDERDGAEARLRRAFGDIAASAEIRDRGASLAAVERGRAAVADIDRLLGRELEAALGLEAFDDVSREATRLGQGIRTTRASLRLFSRELDLAALDPFLGDEANVDEIRRLARRAAKLAVTGELEIRRADRAIAVALGLAPRLDRGLDAETTTGR
jgi:hypothetical protein